MPKEYFTIDRVTSLQALNAGAKIHFIGVCGVAMAQLAVALSQRGYVVSGSDKEFYEPMASLLKSSQVQIYTGYDAKNISNDVALVVIGNAISYGHPEVAVLEDQKLPYTFLPKLLFELVTAERHSFVVAGTHGKTTTTACLASVLVKLGLNPSYFIGGLAKDLPCSLYVGNGQYSVVEGDEYDSAFFAKLPKFHFYRPNSLIVTSVEYDHADIYPDLQSINREFDKLVRGLSSQDLAICCIDDGNLSNLVDVWRQESKCKILTYGISKQADLCLTPLGEKGGLLQAKVCSDLMPMFTFGLNMGGTYNLKNALSVIIACVQRGLSLEPVLEHIATFKGVKRRQDLRVSGKISLIEDFAHHPTAVRETLTAIRARYPKAQLWAVFEPRSNTSRKRVFQEAYIEAFKCADRVVLCEVAVRAGEGIEDLMDVKALGQAIDRKGVKTLTLPNADKIYEMLVAEVQDGDVVLVMSNGGFGGLVGKLEGEWKRS